MLLPPCCLFTQLEFIFLTTDLTDYFWLHSYTAVQVLISEFTLLQQVRGKLLIEQRPLCRHKVRPIPWTKCSLLQQPRQTYLTSPVNKPRSLSQQKNIASLNFLCMGKGTGIRLCWKSPVQWSQELANAQKLKILNSSFPCKERNPGTPHRTPMNLCDPLTTFWAKVWSNDTIHSCLFEETKCQVIYPLRTLLPCLTKTWQGVLGREEKIQARNHFVVEMTSRENNAQWLIFRVIMHHANI